MSINKKDLYVSPEAASEYKENLSFMMNTVNNRMVQINSKYDLIQNNQISVMTDNHKHHAKFMCNIFELNDYVMLKNTISWVLNSYTSRGFKNEYFELELNEWIKVIEKTLDKRYSFEILEVYNYMQDLIKDIKESPLGNLKAITYPYSLEWEKKKDNFTDLLIHGDLNNAMYYANDIVTDSESLNDFYEKVLTYSMYDIGEYWENARITVSQEHLATSTVFRVITSLYTKVLNVNHTKGTAIITACVNEYHVLGARIVADSLELDGWNVMYLGANTPMEDLIKTILETKPFFIGFAVTMVFNIDKLIETITKIRTTPSLENVKIMVGGYAFMQNSDCKNKIDADKIVESCEESIEIAREWWEEKDF